MGWYKQWLETLFFFSLLFKWPTTEKISICLYNVRNTGDIIDAFIQKETPNLFYLCSIYLGNFGLKHISHLQLKWKGFLNCWSFLITSKFHVKASRKWITHQIWCIYKLTNSTTGMSHDMIWTNPSGSFCFKITPVLCIRFHRNSKTKDHTHRLKSQKELSQHRKQCTKEK